VLSVAGKPRDAGAIFPRPGRHIEFDRTGNIVIRSADDENHTLEVDRITRRGVSK